MQTGGRIPLGSPGLQLGQGMRFEGFAPEAAVFVESAPVHRHGKAESMIDAGGEVGEVGEVAAPRYAGQADAGVVDLRE